MTEHRLATVGHFESDLSVISEEALHRPRYEMYEDRMEIYDTVWGHEVITDEVLLALARTDALRRLQTVEQLTLPDNYKTIPNSTHFSRWEHAWGATIFAGRMAEEMGVGSEEKLEMQLRALLSDVCHTAYSHAGDWLLQGKGKKETLHDERLLHYAETVGISEVLRRYKYDPKTLLVQRKDGIIDAAQGALDVDRIDYTLREAYRWVNQIPEFREILNKDSFTVRDGQIVVRNKQAATLLGISYILLVTEHWQEPAHRLQLELFMESIKRVMVARTDQRNELGTYSPFDLLMTSDDVLGRVAEEHDEFMPILSELMRGVSDFEVNNRWPARADRARTALSAGLHGRGVGIEWMKAQYEQLPRAYEIQPAQDSRLRNTKNAHVINLARLRPRYLNPPYIDSDGDVRLLDQDKDFKQYSAEARANVERNWRAAIIGNEASTRALRECFEINQSQWSKVLLREPMPNSLVREQLRRTVATSNGGASRFVTFIDHAK